MIIEVLSVSRRQPTWLSDVTTGYARRLVGHINLGFKHVPPGQAATSTEERLKEESKRLTKQLKPNTHTVVLDRRGKEHDSEALSAQLAHWRANFDRVAFIIGGPDGLEASFCDNAAGRWSLSKLTLPHLVVQIIVAEQIYRAWSILEGHPYHRA